MNIAMWSGPRNLSTALMRSFAQRRDCQVWDEPFYANYLLETGLGHPMRDEIIADGIADSKSVIAACIEAPIPPLKVFYQKHMTQHMGPTVDREWMGGMTNAFLIRSPERVLASYAKKRQNVVAGDLGYGRQLELFQFVCDLCGEVPVVVDSTDIRKAPQAMLMILCNRLGLEFDPEMLSWQSGPSDDDGIWGKHWYDNIWKSTGFAPPDKDPEPLPDHLQDLCDQILPDYLAVKQHKIIAE
ncbi:MAG: HAD family hydrolase [Hyphomicrobiales bacterium]|nr:HAD family hydrolase [Hyphomicrobiales bacterium]